MDKQAILARKEKFEQRKKDLLESLEYVEEVLRVTNNLEKPFVANVSSYSGHYSMQFKTEKAARKKLMEYASKKYFKNGLNYGVYLYKWNEDGTKELLEVIPMGRDNFKPNLD